MENKSLPLSGKRVIVVGGAGLLGSKICDELVKSGATCVIADASEERAVYTASEIKKKYNVKPLTKVVSIVDILSIDKMIKECSDEFGGIDSLVNSAYPRNKQYGRKFEDVTFNDFCENTNMHLGGYFLVSQRILEYFKLNEGGNLLNMSSIYGVVPPKFNVYNNTPMTMPVEYAAIKSAIIHLTKYMARYYAGNNIRVNTLSLGGLLDAQPESFLNAYRDYCLDKGMLNTDDIVGTVAFLLSDAARYINGQNIVVDDGFTL